MPRFKPMAKFERSALADLCKHTLSHIPTMSGRLVYLANLRDVNSGVYRHHGLATAFGRDEAAKALRESHHATFQGWLKLSLAEKHSDFREYLMALDEPAEQVLAHWVRSAVYRSYVPASALQVETELFCRDLETLLEMMRLDWITRRPHSGGDAQDQDSSRLA